MGFIEDIWAALLSDNADDTSAARRLGRTGPCRAFGSRGWMRLVLRGG